MSKSVISNNESGKKTMEQAYQTQANLNMKLQTIKALETHISDDLMKCGVSMDEKLFDRALYTLDALEQIIDSAIKECEEQEKTRLERSTE